MKMSCGVMRSVIGDDISPTEFSCWLQQYTPLRNSVENMRKTMAMTTAYPSAPAIVKGTGAGGAGGGAGQDARQSKHEHPG